MNYWNVLVGVWLFFVVAVLQSCQPNSISNHSIERSVSNVASTKAVMGLSSTAFDQGHDIPKQFTADGKDVSPPLSWASIPEGTQSLVLIVDDPSVGQSPWVHWVIYAIPASMTGLDAGVPNNPTTTFGAMQGTDSWGTIGYRGPSPPPGQPHEYRFRLYAIDGMPNMISGLTASQVMSLLKGHVLATAEMTASYGRQVQAK